MAAEQPIPVYTNLTDLYGSLGTSLNHALRWNNLVEEFERRFGRKPAYIARAPGRVNLIGEHIDYALFGVLPAAIERDILIACAPRPSADAMHSHGILVPGSVTIQNLDSKYPPHIFAPERRTTLSTTEIWDLDINTKELRWESYVKAGYYGVLNRYFPLDSKSSLDEPVSVDMLVSGSVPAGSGLSSSAAMVVASTLALLAVNGKLRESGLQNSLNKGDLVRMAVENEKRVGVNSGGMDQAASVISTPGSALYISFFPSLAASPVPLPAGAVFICANSLVVSDKLVTAKKGYNLRVVETLVGARILAKLLGVKIGEKEKITYREVVGRYALGPKHDQAESADQELSEEELRDALQKLNDEEVLKGLKPIKKDNEGVESEELGVTMEEMIAMTGMSPGDFHDVYLSWVDVEATHFQLYKRAKHVLSESLRVLQFRQACLEASNVKDLAGSLDQQITLQALGGLMNESQESCSKLFECSCPELDLLTKLAKEAGAIGSRLTGAGWGGCTVSLVKDDQVDAFVAKIRETYPAYKELSDEKFNEVVFATRPSSGACVYKFD
ncbi:hypothetical protein AX16_007335 [Volvariella volvacea WC 439]|nr:hypothetical protein AX16_007335 [Volvariella volvacea WC 439]